ncbi:MAG TPA: aconitase X catalytic domain-containing protein [Methanotrichaceae archaeon]|nr:aconitase X catalytic domain-containing protein [Methanotrichaceae archaeon]
MYLTREEEAIYQGGRGESLRRMMEILVALGDIYEAERLVPVKSVQIAGVSFKNIGDAGLEWISDLRGTVAVPSILNPAGMDLVRWHEMGVKEGFAEKQRATVDAYRSLGISIDCTCTPYQICPDIVSRGDHLAWSESSAVSYANSVIGARTNREGGPSALAAALVGKTPLYGYHLDECRMPTHSITVDTDLKGSDYGALGFQVGRIVKDGVPIFQLRSRPGQDELKALGAAMAASGSVALYYVLDVTPSPPLEATSQKCEEISIGEKEILDVYEEHGGDDAEIVALGCPHCSMQELARIADLLDGKEVKRELWVCTARRIANAWPDLVARIERSGAKVICDTCMVVSPASENYRKMMVNSGKALAYIPGLCGIEACFGSTESCIDMATRRL